MQIENEYTQGQVILIDKPLNWTSFDVVNKLRIALTHGLGIRKLKVGHAGTLDPLATGLVIVCTGKMTKSIELFQAEVKEYVAELTLGCTTPSYDGETEIDARFPTEHITQALVQETLTQFVGDQMQVPPVFSAISIDGKRAYKSARAGRQIEMQARPVHISQIELLGFQENKIEIRVVCSKGTYIRSLAHDIGRALASGAYLTALRRTRIGDFSVENALSVQEFVQKLPQKQPNL